MRRVEGKFRVVERHGETTLRKTTGHRNYVALKCCVEMLKYRKNGENGALRTRGGLDRMGKMGGDGGGKTGKKAVFLSKSLKVLKKVASSACAIETVC